MCSPVTRKLQFPTVLPLHFGAGSDHCPCAVHSVLDGPSRTYPSLQWKSQREPEVRSAGARSQVTEPSAGHGTASHLTAATQGAQQQSAQMLQENNTMALLTALRAQVSRDKERYLHRLAAACPRPQKTHTAV